MANPTARENFQRLQVLEEQAESADAKRIIEAMNLQTRILADLLAQVQMNLITLTKK